MSALTHPAGNLADVVCELDMLGVEVGCLPSLRPHLDADCWPVDERITITLENIVHYATAALAAIRERDGKQLTAWTQLAFVDAEVVS